MSIRRGSAAALADSPAPPPGGGALSPLSAIVWLQLQDSAFPTGRFVHSQGLEAWLQAHPEADPAGLAEVCRSFLVQSLAPQDAVSAAWAWNARTAASLATLDFHLEAHKLSEAARTSSARTGRQFARAVRRVHPELGHNAYIEMVIAGDVPGHTAVVEGCVARALHLPMDVCVVGLLRSSYAQLLSAAVRLGRLGSLAAQQLLARDAPLLVELTAAAVAEAGPLPGSSLPDLHASALELEIRAMQHERVTARLFAS